MRPIDADNLLSIVMNATILTDGFKKVFRCLVDGEPTIEPEPHWIPCSERLPKYRDERYLCALAWGGVGVLEFKDCGWYMYGDLSPVPFETVTAWMPLPEPYKEGE